MVDLARARDVADFLDVSIETVRRWARAGKIPCYPIHAGRNGAPLYFDMEDIEGAIRSQKTYGTTSEKVDWDAILNEDVADDNGETELPLGLEITEESSDS